MRDPSPLRLLRRRTAASLLAPTAPAATGAPRPARRAAQGLGALAGAAAVLATWAWGVPAAAAACDASHIAVAVDPVVVPSHTLLVRWWVDARCAAVETGLLLGRDPAALAPAGPPRHGGGPGYRQSLPIEETGTYWVAAYARAEDGAVARSAPRPVIVIVPPELPAEPTGSHGAPAFYLGDDRDFLQPAGEPHYAAFRHVLVRHRRFGVRPITGGAFVDGSDLRLVASTRADEVVEAHAEPLEVDTERFPVDPQAVDAALEALDADFAARGFPRAGLYAVACSVYRQWAPEPELEGPECRPFPESAQVLGWVAFAEVRSDLVAASIRSAMSYLVPQPPEGKRVQSARLRVFAFNATGRLGDIPLNGRRPVAVEETSCRASGCSGWATWDFTAEARALADQGGGELFVALDPVPLADGFANYGLLPRASYPWHHGAGSFALTIAFEDACPRELALVLDTDTLRPVLPLKQAQAADLTARATTTTVEARVETCQAEGASLAPVEIAFEVQPPDGRGQTGHDGSHEHTTLRPTGAIQDLDRGQLVDGCLVDRFDEAGLGSCVVVYRAGEASGVETIVARAADYREVRETIAVRIDGFQPLPSNPELYVLVGAPGNHSGTNDPCRPSAPKSLHEQSHYGRPTLIANMTAIAKALVAKTGILPRINDMSLPWGGLFDVNNSWSPPHRTHRTGRDADIGFRGIKGGGCVEYDRKLLRGIIHAVTGRDPLKEGDHFHVSGG